MLPLSLLTLPFLPPPPQINADDLLACQALITNVVDLDQGLGDMVVKWVEGGEGGESVDGRERGEGERGKAGGQG